MNKVIDLVNDKFNKNLKANIFIGLGLASLSIINPLLGLTGLVTTPMIFLNILNKHKLKKERFVNIDKKFFSDKEKEDFQTWFEDYIKIDKHPAQSEYKIIFYTLWSKMSGLNLEMLLDTKTDNMKNILNSLTASRRGNYNIEKIIDTRTSIHNMMEFINISSTLENDIRNPELLSMIKKTLEPYKEQPLLGKLFCSYTDYLWQPVLIAQEYKFSEADYAFMKERFKEKDNNGVFYLSFKNTQCMPLIQLIISNEYNKENLLFLKEFFSAKSNLHKEKTTKMIDDQLLFYRLENEMPTNETSTKSKKSNKI